MSNTTQEILVDTQDKISDSTVISGELLEISLLFYFIGLILLLIIYTGPYMYFKYYKKKNFSNFNNNINVQKQAI